MIVIRTKNEIAILREAGRISAEALLVGGQAVQPGITTKEIDTKIEHYIRSQKAIPSFLGYGGFPASACISVNEEVIHGIPGSRVIQEGDLVSIDVGAFYNGYHGDNAATFGAGKVSDENQKLMDVTKECLEKGIAAALVGNRIGDISWAVQQSAEQHGYGVVREYVGHGVGAKLHEDPEVPNFGKAGHGTRLVAGMVLAIEPMINLGVAGVRVLGDDWTVVTKDGKPSAHFENTIAITDNGPLILTKP